LARRFRFTESVRFRRAAVRFTLLRFDTFLLERAMGTSFDPRRM
jgi:hypothetical protein